MLLKDNQVFLGGWYLWDITIFPLDPYKNPNLLDLKHDFI